MSLYRPLRLLSLRAKIADEKSGDIDGQILNRELSGELTLEQVYDDSTLREAMTSGMAGRPLQHTGKHRDHLGAVLRAEDRAHAPAGKGLPDQALVGPAESAFFAC